VVAAPWVVRRMVGIVARNVVRFALNGGRHADQQDVDEPTASTRHTKPATVAFVRQEAVAGGSRIRMVGDGAVDDDKVGLLALRASCSDAFHPPGRRLAHLGAVDCPRIEGKVSSLECAFGVGLHPGNGQGG
jgi:hypothetical protein